MQMSINTTGKPKGDVVSEIRQLLESDGYSIAELEVNKPWGAFFRLDNDDAPKFIEQYFPGLTLDEARLGTENAELSPKILVVSPEQRLSWQYHHRRAERWNFLTGGSYVVSKTDEQTPVVQAQAGTVLQIACGERHRLIGLPKDYALVAEIWQHVDPEQASDEQDIVRLQDDYQR